MDDAADTLLTVAFVAGLGLLAYTMFSDALGGSFDINSLFDNNNGDNQDMSGSSKFAGLFQSVGSAAGVPAALLSAVAFTESSYNPDAVNHGSGAQGLMQLMPRWYPSVNAFDPNEAVPAAANSLAAYHRQFGNWYDALAAYNWGPSYVATIRRGGTVRQNGVTYTDLPSSVKAYASGILNRAGGLYA